MPSRPPAPRQPPRMGKRKNGKGGGNKNLRKETQFPLFRLPVTEGGEKERTLEKRGRDAAHSPAPVFRGQKGAKERRRYYLAEAGEKRRGKKGEGEELGMIDYYDACAAQEGGKFRKGGKEG